MAASDTSTFEKELTCSICLDLFREPKTLPGCNHVFCEECLNGLVRNMVRDVYIKCPECRTVSNIKKTDIAALKTNLKLCNMAEMLRSRKVTITLTEKCYQFIAKICKQGQSKAYELLGIFIRVVLFLIAVYFVACMLPHVLPLILMILNFLRDIVESMVLWLTDCVFKIVERVVQWLSDCMYKIIESVGQVLLYFVQKTVEVVVVVMCCIAVSVCVTNLPTATWW